MAEYRNKLVIIGNGFDLAHGFKTSYNDFIYWYLTSICENIKRDDSYEDALITVKFKDLQTIFPFKKLNVDAYNLEWFYQPAKSIFNINFNTPLLEKFLSSIKTYSWVDVEAEYYKSLIEIYNEGQQPYYDIVYYLTEVKKLNSAFEFIKEKLEEYLSTIKCDVNDDVNQEINNLFQSDFSRGYNIDEGIMKVHYLNFNYTNTFEKYIRKETNYEPNYIHGKLNTKENPLIFGYGDEIDSYYEKIEQLNINEFLNNFKSFGYFKTENYENLLRFIDSESYDIEILGHSCGLSDRVLLNTIFEHDNCKKIKIHYYQKSETENDFISKTQEISRHFKDKAKMRARIVDFTKCKPLVKYKPNK